MRPRTGLAILIPRGHGFKSCRRRSSTTTPTWPSSSALRCRPAARTRRRSASTPSRSGWNGPGATRSTSDRREPTVWTDVAPRCWQRHRTRQPSRLRRRLRTESCRASPVWSVEGSRVRQDDCELARRQAAERSSVSVAGTRLRGGDRWVSTQFETTSHSSSRRGPGCGRRLSWSLSSPLRAGLLNGLTTTTKPMPPAAGKAFSRWAC